MRTILNLILGTVAVFVTASILPGVKLDGFRTAMIVAVVLGTVNAVLRPVILILTLPINVLTLGLFTFVVIGGLVQLVAWLVPGFEVADFRWALVFALVLWVINAFLSKSK